ncbi:MAG: alanine racemase [Sphingomonadaceae bacterium]
MTLSYAPAMRLELDSKALVANYLWLQDRAGVPLFAAIKADGYGLGATEVAARLLAAGCRGFCVSTWAEALALPPMDAELLVLHGFTAGDAPAAQTLPQARPVLNTLAQVSAWRSAFPDRPADLMVETGMGRLGVPPAEVGAAVDSGVHLQTIHSHLACADIPGHPVTDRQLALFRQVAAATPNVSHVLANTAGICTGRAFSFDGVRGGLGLYGGVAHPDCRVQQVVRPSVRVLQIRQLSVGDCVGYGATWSAQCDSRVAILNIGYADGLPRSLAPYLRFRAGDAILPAVGRISMDMTAVDVTDADVQEGDWLELHFDVAVLSDASGISQYELLTGLSRRYVRHWS